MFFQVTQPQTGMMGLSGMGAFAGRGGSLDVGTQLELRTYIDRGGIGENLYGVNENELDAIAKVMRTFLYKVHNRFYFPNNSSIVFIVEVQHQKNSEDSAITDFMNAVKDGGGWIAPMYPYNTTVKVLAYPDEVLPRVPSPIDTSPADLPDTKTKVPPDPNKKSYLDLMQEFFDKQFGFLGGTVSGAMIALAAVAGFYIIKNR